MYRSGSFVAEHVTPTTDEQVQPNGVDLTLEVVYEQREPGRIARDGKEIGARQRLPAESMGVDDAGEATGAGGTDGTGGTNDGDGKSTTDGDTYYLPAGGYVVRYGEVVSIPEGHVGFIYPRSSLLRNSCMLNTAVWDAGYRGKGEGLLQVHHDVELAVGARIAQFVLAEANHDEAYDGSYQEENI